MKKGLLAGTVLVGAAGLAAGVAGAAEAPTWKLTGNANFQFYWVDQDATGVVDNITTIAFTGPDGTWSGAYNPPGGSAGGMSLFGVGTQDARDHDWYFGVDEAELQLNVSGTADNGLNYGFKIEINANTTDNTVVDEARLQFSGGWGTLQMGDEDGAEDIMNYGGENLMGATGGFDGDQDDYLYHAAGAVPSVGYQTSLGTLTGYTTKDDNALNIAAPSYASIAGDTSDKTKVSYFSPRFSGFQVGASLTPTPNNGDGFKADGDWENHIGIGANYDNSFGDLRIRASAVFSAATNTVKLQGGNQGDAFADVSAFSVGGIVGWGPFSLGANYTDNGESGQPYVYDWLNEATVVAPIETSYWNVAASFETGPMYFSAGYFSSLADISVGNLESSYDHIALTADYTVAPGLGVYAEINLISEELLGTAFTASRVGNVIDTLADNGVSTTNDATSLVIGANISF